MPYLSSVWVVLQHCSFSLSTYSFGRVGRSFKRTMPPKANRYTRNNSTNTKIPPPTGGGRWLSLPKPDSAEGFFLLKVSFSFPSSPAYRGSSDCCGYLPNTVGYEGTLLLLSYTVSKAFHTNYWNSLTQITEMLAHTTENQEDFSWTGRWGKQTAYFNTQLTQPRCLLWPWKWPSKHCCRVATHCCILAMVSCTMLAAPTIWKEDYLTVPQP